MNNYNQPYIPNGYGNWPYQQNQQIPQTYQNQFLNNSYQNFSFQQQVLNGKFVDSVEVVKATEVPMGGTGIFPKADMSEVYIKSWNPNGTTSIITYKPYVEKQGEPQETVKTDDVLVQISALNEKIDKLIGDLGA